ncbi:hypothetical protein FA10DRAFT_301187 [Acaromyces ingoldii]|uniref:MINDY deubiquitinase domain-containing protein n=1 Tax=Acaromyces ingoldii TaxID=215250 RepID=A0A316YLE8_9BASI|nr:hypothetical protein FA10DRAFT_301187 [Acaromyces ingoldii]PWN89886.1 hypothetical protein FA10DRAFT_301187 [Acaromyces ingoldii]
MSTNPFAAAVSGSEPTREEAETNPFKSHSRTTSDAVGVQSTPSNPFHPMATFGNHHQPTQQQQQQQQQQQPQELASADLMSGQAQQQQQSTTSNDISSQLAGLDFGSGATSSPAPPQLEQSHFTQESQRQGPVAAESWASQPDHTAAAAGTSDKQGDLLDATSAGTVDEQVRMPQAQTATTDPFASEMTFSPAAPASNTEVQQPTANQYRQTSGGSQEAAQGTFAPPPGPPPGHEAGSTAPSDQIVADEAYARQLLASEQKRAQRHRNPEDQRHGSSGQYALAASSSDAPRSSYRRQEQPLNGTYATQPAARDANEEKQWNTKEIYWRGRSQRIVLQNENGPCSLIALCNVLFLRGTLTITPEDRPAVSYSYLSSLLAEHLLDVIRDDSALDLEAALSILPQTQTGLDVNVRFDAIDGFAVEEKTQPSSEPSGSSSSAAAALPAKTDADKQRGELALFKLCNVPLVHGWLADKDDKETYAAVVERAGDYDRALDRVVAGDELAKGTIVGGSASGFGAENLSAEQGVVVNDAVLIRNFLESTATQLTYPGLYALSTTLERGVPYALFRNSHLSVIYRPLDQEVAATSGDAIEPGSAPPALYQLVTDATLETEDNVVWESLEDIDGSASRFFDAKFRPAKVTQDFVGRRNQQQQQEFGQGYTEDGDMALAQQLQEEERDRVRRHQAARASRRQQQQQQTNFTSSSGGQGGGNVISRMLAARKSNKRAPSSQVHLRNEVADGMGGRPVDASSARQQQQQQTQQLTPAQTEAQAAQAQMRADLGEGSGEPKKTKWWKKF